MERVSEQNAHIDEVYLPLRQCNTV